MSVFLFDHLPVPDIRTPLPGPIAAGLLARDTVYVSGSYTRVYPLVVDRGRSVKANISLDAGQLDAIDAEAARRGLTRSAFLAAAALELIARP